MKEILKTSKGWFIFSYIIGMMYFIMYILWKENNSEALFANGYLMILSHFCTFVALAICGNRVVRRQIIWKTFTIFVALLGVFIFWTPCIMSLVGGYAAFCIIGLIHIRLIKEQDMFGHIKKAESPEDASQLSDKQWKYILWAGISFAPLLLCYWQI